MKYRAYAPMGMTSFRRSTTRLSARSRVTSVMTPSAAVAPDHTSEHVRVASPARLDQRAVGKEHVEAANGTDQWTLTHVSAMHVDRHRAADGEVGVGLHDLDGEVVRIERFLDVAPPCAGLDRYGLGDSIEGENALELPHIDLQRPWLGGLPTLAEPSATDRNRTSVTPERGRNLFRRGGRDDRRDRDRIEPGHIVDDEVDLGGKCRIECEIPDRHSGGQDEDAGDDAARPPDVAPGGRQTPSHATAQLLVLQAWDLDLRWDSYLRAGVW